MEVGHVAQGEIQRHAILGRFAARWRSSAPYRPLMALVLLSSTASFAALGVLSLFARDELGATDTMVTILFVAVALASMITMLATGHLSDRGRARRILIPASLAWLAIGYWMLAGVHSYAAMLAVEVVFFCAIGIPNAQLLAYARDLVERRDDTQASIAVIALIRIALAVGTFLGFGTGGLGLAYLGARSVFRIVALVCLGCLGLWWYVLRRGDAAPVPVRRKAVDGSVPESGRVQPSGTAQRLLLVLAVVMVLFASGRVLLLSQLPILMRASLHAPLQLVGLALGLPSVCELVLLPAMAWAALQWGRGRVFLVGGAASVVYYGGLLVVAAPWQLLLLQVSYAVFAAATVMVGIDLAQGLMAGRAGTATSIYLSHENVALVNGSLVATLSVAMLGHRNGFIVPGTLCLVALTLTMALFARHPDKFDLRRKPTESATTL
jgi:SET family sugar efflux transporter-like MFS transporter